MNKPQAHDGMIPVKEYADKTLNRRGFPMSVSYVYKLIREHKKGGQSPPFEYVEKGKTIFIIEPQNSTQDGKSN